MRQTIHSRVLIALALIAALMAPAYVARGEDKKPDDKKGKEKPKPPPEKKDPPKEAAKEAPKELPKQAAVDPNDEAARVMAQKDKEKGAQTIGKDPAFVLMPRPLDRNESAQELMTPQVKEMIEKALTYLKNTQSSDGSWSDGAEFNSNTGVTALASMAFMAEGSQPRVGRFGVQIDHGMEFLIKSFQPQTGAIAAGGNSSNKLGPMYEHALSTLALLYAWGDMPWRKVETEEILTQAVQAIVHSQLKELKQGGAGWRYTVKSREGQADMSVTGNVLWVLRTAKKCGFYVKPEAVANGVKFVEQCANPDGTFRYRFFGLHAEPSLGGTGVIALFNHGQLDHPLIPNAVKRIDEDYRIYTVNDLKARRYAIYGFFYASLAMYTQGDDHWIPWYKKVVQVLSAMQGKDGEFHDEFGCSVYTTAMAAMILQAPLGYLPIYER
jgi:hypothetical protein